MKVLILSCNTGGGHNSAAKAILEELNRRNIECKLVDSLQFAGHRASYKVKKTYTDITRYAPDMFGLLYCAGNAISSNKRKSPVYYANKLYYKNCEEFIENGKFDTIIVSHLFPAQTITAIKRRTKLKAITISIATDYTCIPFWEETDMDYYIIPHPVLLDEFANKGIPKSKLVPLGIPVNNEFKYNKDKNYFRKKLCIPYDKKVFLIMTGSMGFGNIEKLLKKLLSKAGKNIFCCVLIGNNKKLKFRLMKKYCYYENIRIVDFTNDVSDYMNCADILLTKPGGLTSTEAAVSRIPIIHTPPIPGCETKNAEFFSLLGISIYKKSMDEIVKSSLELINSKEKCLEMMKRQNIEINQNSAYDICNFIDNHK